MNFLRKIKNTAISAYISTNKIQENLAQVVNNADADIRFEQQVRQQELKLVSKKKFYEILERLDDIQYRRFRENQSESIIDRSFINKRYGSIHESTGDVDNATYHLKTNNLLGKYASHVNLITEENQHVLEFVINTTTNPISRTLDFTNLTTLSLNENGKTYSFNILSYLGSTQNNPYENSLYFLADIEKFGVYDFEMDETQRVLTSRDTPPKNTINYNPNLGL